MEILKNNKFYILTLLIFAVILSSYKIGSVVGILSVLVAACVTYIAGEKYTDLLFYILLVTIQAYSLFARLYLIPGEIRGSSMIDGIGGGIVLLMIVLLTPMAAVFPVLRIKKREKSALLLMLIPVAITAYWLLLFKFTNNF